MANAFLALGDSYTIGEGVPPAQRWPARLATRLRAQGHPVDGPRIIATTGWTTDELAAALDAASLDPPYALVSLAIGVNNQYRGRPLDEYGAQFRALLQRALALAGDRPRGVVVASIPDWGWTPLARREGRDSARVAREIDAFNATARAECEAVGTHWIDVTGISRAPELRGELAADGLHPSAAQYARWVEAILPAARAALQAP